MDLIKLLRSLEEFVFEAITWLIFYPFTIWRIVTRPLATMAYSDTQQGNSDTARYDDALSPPLLLLVTIILVNTVAGTLHPDAPANSHIARELVASPEYLELFRALIFSIVPLTSAVTLLRHLKIRVSRETLRPPFYAQCYLATPCCLFFGLGVALLMRPDIPKELGAILLLAGGVWFSVTQVRWFRTKLGTGWGTAVLRFAQTIMFGSAVLIAAVLLILVM